MMKLKPSNDSKVQAYDKHGNTFGTLPRTTCPGATYGPGGCCDIPEGRKLHVCYVDRIMSAYSGVKGVLEHNTEALSGTLDEMFDVFWTEFNRFKSKPKNQDTNNFYRLYWSGDIHNEECAQALAEAILYHADVNFWGYTRSFFALPYFADLPNCQLYLSLDAVNFDEGMEAYNDYQDRDNISYCYLSKDRPTNLDVLPCPVDSGKLEIKGACYKCKLCMKGKPIWFKAK